MSGNNSVTLYSDDRLCWQLKGLYNGALRTVRGIVFGDDVKRPSQPICAVIEFDDNCGPALIPQRRIVPVASETVAFDP